MKAISIETGSKSYPVFVDSHSLEHLNVFLKENFPSLTKLLIITDETVERLHLSTLLKYVSSYHPVSYTVPSGELAKTFDVYYQCLTYSLQEKLDRHSVILALGGGAVGDLAGFVAATYMRGIPFIQIPTTILAHDSAVGGKVAINHPSGKNMIGAFYQPEAVFYHIDFLKSLPINEKRSGFAEAIKHALISDEALYDWMRLNLLTLDSIPEETLISILTRGIEIKGEIVAQDEKETGVRAFLNFGHTLGHAIEAEMGYGNMTHGEAVVIGMHFALRLSQKVSDLSFQLVECNRWLRKLGYDIKVPEHLQINRLVDRMKQDKKAYGQKLRFVLLEKVGRPTIVELEEEFVIKELEMFMNGGEC
ncbi:3-dehydroquinate synthase [Bacillus sp. 03113]|uniref:3-dehydroquinate synthase n=1 Tax=Bacillus sp. 03113 TaxID=2578211 RepID=UPI001141A456|nr:3-dehydroquinate synthase [Bacillus sp. 03113]